MPGYPGSNYNTKTTKSLSGGSKKKSRRFTTFAKQLRNLSKKNKSMKKMKGGSSCGSKNNMKGGSNCGSKNNMKGGSNCGNHKKMKGGFIRDFSPMRNVSGKRTCRS